MRMLAGLAAAAIACVVMAGTASAQSVDRYDARVLTEMAEDLGYDLEESKGTEEQSGPYVIMAQDDGKVLGFQGMVCDDKKANSRCLGVLMYAPLDMPGDDVDLPEFMNEFNTTYNVGKMMVDGDGLALVRYMIMDGGISRANLEANVVAFEELYRIAQDELGQ